MCVARLGALKGDDVIRRRPRLSVVVVAYDMARELPNTLYSLSSVYQRDINERDYEVILVDNGSPKPVSAKAVKSYGSQFRYLRIDDAPASPALALNRGVELSRGRNLALMVDGARLVTPGLLGQALRVFDAYDDVTVAVPGWHLGPDVQQRSVANGYCQNIEDRMLEASGWQEDGYRLFDLAVPGESCKRGFLLPMAESNAIMLPKSSFHALGGIEERFDLPGGGLVNLDFYRRAVLRREAAFVVMPGEGTFHQIHGGISTNVTAEDLGRRWQQWEAQYRQIRGEPYHLPERQPILFGEIPTNALRYFHTSVTAVLEGSGDEC